MNMCLIFETHFVFVCPQIYIPAVGKRFKALSLISLKIASPHPHFDPLKYAMASAPSILALVGFLSGFHH